MKLVLLFAAIFIGALPLQAYSQLGSPPPVASDSRVKRALDEAGLKYTVDSDGDFKLIFDIENDRTQIVWVNSKTYKYGEFEIREVWSVAYASDSLFNSTVANRLLKDNEDRKLGAWQTKRLNGKYAAVFAAKVAASMSSDQLASAIRAVRSTADEIENELTSRDDW